MSKKNTTQLIIVGVLILVLIALSKNAIDAVGKAKTLREKTLHSDILDKNTQEQLQEQADATERLSLAGDETYYKKLLEQTKDLPLTRNPFSYVGIAHKRAASVGEGGLSAILFSEDQSQSVAIINHKVVKNGDKADNNIVVDIKEDRVILNDGNKDFELKLKK